MGSDEYPDRSATLIIEVTALRDIDGIAELSGPGIETIRRLEAPPLGLSFWTDLMELHQDYPLGVDVILMAPGAIAAVPRSTRITIREAL
jgi:alpha-D-ribose 1-methylphosphonate 5-triphosphate synthase subunit PhnH